MQTPAIVRITITMDVANVRYSVPAIRHARTLQRAPCRPLDLAHPSTTPRALRADFPVPQVIRIDYRGETGPGGEPRAFEFMPPKGITPAGARLPRAHATAGNGTKAVRGNPDVRIIVNTRLDPATACWKRACPDSFRALHSAIAESSARPAIQPREKATMRYAALPSLHAD